jgi:hypothetical protein
MTDTLWQAVPEHRMSAKSLKALKLSWPGVLALDDPTAAGCNAAKTSALVKTTKLSVHIAAFKRTFSTAEVGYSESPDIQAVSVCSPLINQLMH